MCQECGTVLHADKHSSVQDPYIHTLLYVSLHLLYPSIKSKPGNIGKVFWRYVSDYCKSHFFTICQKYGVKQQKNTVFSYLTVWHERFLSPALGSA
jgi:hypothetical protein